MDWMCHLLCSVINLCIFPCRNINHLYYSSLSIKSDPHHTYTHGCTAGEGSMGGYCTSYLIHDAVKHNVRCCLYSRANRTITRQVQASSRLAASSAWLWRCVAIVPQSCRAAHSRCTAQRCVPLPAHHNNHVDYPTESAAQLPVPAGAPQDC